MKRYTVEQIVKLENQTEFLRSIQKQKLDKLYSWPLVVLTVMGMIFTGEYFAAEQRSILQLIIGASTILTSGTGLACLLSVDQIRGKLREKLNKIYDVMGEDFEKNVEREQFIQNNNLFYNQILATHGEEKIDEFFGGRQR